MSTIVYRIAVLLGAIVADVPVGTNLGLFWLLWALISGRFLPSRGAVFPALADGGLPADAVRRSGGSCSSSLRVNTRGLPSGHYKAKKFYQRGPSGSPSGPLTPGDGLDASHADARRHSGPLPLLCPTTPVDSHPHRLRPGWHTKQQHFAQRPDVISEPRGHGRRPRPPLRGGARAVGRDRLCQRHA